MKIKLQPLAVFAISIVSVSGLAQSNINNSGNWDNSGIWSAGIPSGIGSDATWSQNKTVTFPNSAAYSTTSTIGNMTMDNSDVLNIGDGTASNVNLILGASGTPKDLTANNTATITVKAGGTLEIWGNLVINNHLILDVQAGSSLVVHGNITIANSATFDVSGSVAVSGNFTTGTSANINVTGGSVTVTGNVTAGNSSCLVLSGGGTFSTSGTCTPPGGSNCSSGAGGSFCSTVPITLSSFKATAYAQSVELNWSTASEKNFDYFLIERSSNGTQFSNLTQVKGSGNSITRKNYSYSDYNPIIGNSYYRLTSIDFDGYTEVFNNSVVRVTVNAGKNFFIIPNPIEGNKLKGGVNFDASNSQVVIYDRMGIIVDRYTLTGTEFEMPLPNLPNGVYFAQLQSGEYTKSVRFLVGQ